MIKVLFVCHGNICRSTMAQSMFQDMVNKMGLSGQFEIDSAATSREEIGNASAASGKGQELVDLAVGISACKACHVRDIIRIHADQVIVMLIICACHLARTVGNYRDADGAELAYGSVVRTVADLLTARRR